MKNMQIKMLVILIWEIGPDSTLMWGLFSGVGDMVRNLVIFAF